MLSRQKNAKNKTLGRKGIRTHNKKWASQLESEGMRRGGEGGGGRGSKKRTTSEQESIEHKTKQSNPPTPPSFPREDKPTLKETNQPKTTSLQPQSLHTLTNRILD